MLIYKCSIPLLLLLRKLPVLMFAVVAVSLSCGCSKKDPVDVPEVSSEPKLAPVASSLHVRPVYTYALKTIAFDSRGSLLATGDGDGQVRLWNADGKSIRTIQAHEGWTFSVSFHPSEQLLASGGGDNLVKIWDVSTGEKKYELVGHTDDVHGVIFIEAGSRLASVGDDQTVRIWDLATQEAKVLNGHTRQVTAIKVSPDGKLLASASRDATVRLWNAETGKHVRTLKGHEADILDLAFIEQGNLLVTSSYDTTVRLWDVQTGKQLRTYANHDGRVLSVAVSPDGSKLASGCSDKKLRISSLSNGDLLHTIEIDSDASALDYSPDGHMLSVALADGSARLFDVQGKLPRQTSQLGKVRSTLSQEASSLTPQEYLNLHQLAVLPGNDDWKKAVARLTHVGDGFTLHVMREVDKSKLSPEDATLLTSMVEAISKRIANLDAVLVATEIQVRLERAATADLGCNALEGQIANWTQKWLKPHIGKPDVQQELERIRDHYESDQKLGFGDFRSRIRDYAAKLLEGDRVEASG